MCRQRSPALPHLPFPGFAVKARARPKKAQPRTHKRPGLCCVCAKTPYFFLIVKAFNKAREAAEKKKKEEEPAAAEEEEPKPTTEELLGEILEEIRKK